MVGSVRRNQNLYSGCLGLGKGIREICDLIAGRLATIGVRKMAIRYENCQLAEVGLDTDSPIGVTRPSDLNTGSVPIITDDIPMTKGNKSASESRPPTTPPTTPLFPNPF